MTWCGDPKLGKKVTFFPSLLPRPFNKLSRHHGHGCARLSIFQAREGRLAREDERHLPA